MTNSPMANNKIDSTKKIAACNCNDVKTILKIRVAGNFEDLTISCNGLKTAENIADLVDGYCRIVNNTTMSLWDRTSTSTTRMTPNNSATNSLEKLKHQQHHSLPPMLTTSQSIDSTKSHEAESLGAIPIDGYVGGELPKPMLSEDYVELGLGDEEGDYSTPAVRNYELDRSQITLADIIGVGQFGDVHIGTCHINKSTKISTVSLNEDSSLKEATGADGTENSSENGIGKAGVIHVAVKTCKTDSDMVTSEKFLEEACKCTTIICTLIVCLFPFETNQI